MVETQTSFCSDDSTICGLIEEDILEEQMEKITSGPSSLVIEVRDIESNFSRPSSIKDEEPRLLHPALLAIPIQVRFGIAGTVSNVIFMILYNAAIPRLESFMAASSVYALVYFLFIPISHLLCSLMVFGWPKEYSSSLLSNFPIGLSALVIGALCTALLDRIRFEDSADNFVRVFILDRPRIESQELGEFYSSLVVMAITGIWTYVVSIMVNASTLGQHEKEQ